MRPLCGRQTPKDREVMGMSLFKRRLEAQEPDDLDEEDLDDEDLPEIEDNYNNPDDEDDDFDEDKLTEESYRTTFETNPEDLNFDAENISKDYED